MFVKDGLPLGIKNPGALHDTGAAQGYDWREASYDRQEVCWPDIALSLFVATDALGDCDKQRCSHEL